jgi:hypothetical protein
MSFLLPIVDPESPAHIICDYISLKRKAATVSSPPTAPDFIPTMLSVVTPHPLDSTIKFNEETHTYYIQFATNSNFDSSGIVSVSGIVHQYFHDFEADLIIARMQKSRAWSRSKYFGMSSSEIKTQWEHNGAVASAAGTAFHFLVECFFNGWEGLRSDVYASSVPVQQFLVWHDQEFVAQGLEPFRTELRFRSDVTLKMCGTADLVAIRTDHPLPQDCMGVLTLFLFDWKNSKEIKFDSPWAKGKRCCAHLPDVNASHYYCQQNLYTWFIETYYNCWTWKGQRYTSVKVARMQLVVCHANHGQKALVVEVPRWDETVVHMIDDRRKKLLMQP